MRVLITGATGFVGAWTAKAVCDRGHRVRFLVRDAARLDAMATALGFDGSDVVTGDMTDAARVGSALDGCDAVIHAAAVVALKAGEADHMIRANLLGAQNVIGQAAARGLDPIVCVSSSVALWHRHCPRLHAELPPGGGGDDYATSKVLMENYVRDLQHGGAPIVVTYPTAVIGPAAGGQVGESGAAVRSFVKGGVFGRGAGLTIVDVRDLAAAHARLLEPGLGPRRYVLGGHHLRGGALAAELSRITGRQVRYLAVPDTLLITAGKLADRFRSRLPAGLDKLSEAGVRYLVGTPPADNTPAERELGITFRPAAETLQAALAARPKRSPEGSREEPGVDDA